MERAERNFLCLPELTLCSAAESEKSVANIQMNHFQLYHIIATCLVVVLRGIIDPNP